VLPAGVPAAGALNAPLPEVPAAGALTAPLPEVPAAGALNAPLPEVPAAGAPTAPLPEVPAAGASPLPEVPAAGALDAPLAPVPVAGALDAPFAGAFAAGAFAAGAPAAGALDAPLADVPATGAPAAGALDGLPADVPEFGTAHTEPSAGPLTVSAPTVPGKPVMSVPTAVAIAVHRLGAAIGIYLLTLRGWGGRPAVACPANMHSAQAGLSQANRPRHPIGRHCSGEQTGLNGGPSRARSGCLVSVETTRRRPF
jgi:hypothetical protein